MEAGLRAFLLAMALILPLVGRDLPKDPNGTLDRVQGGVMRVGISANPPWTAVRNGQFGGVEVALIQAFAREIDARIEWIPAGTPKLLKALEEFQLDLVIGGLTEEPPWKKRVGLTRPYIETASLVGLPPGVAVERGLAGVEVAVAAGDPIIAKLHDKDAKPVPVASRRTADRPVAAEAWQLTAWGFQPTQIVLEKHPHVIAVPPGENGWLVRLEKFLSSRKGDVIPALVAEARHEAE